MVPGVFHPNRASYEPLRTQEAGNHQLACLRGGFGIARGIQGQPGAGSCGVLPDGNSQHHYDDLPQPSGTRHRPCRQTRRHPYSGTILQVPRLNGRSPAYAAGGGKLYGMERHFCSIRGHCSGRRRLAVAFACAECNTVPQEGVRRGRRWRGGKRLRKKYRSGVSECI